MTVRHWLQLAPLAAVAGCLESPPRAAGDGAPIGDASGADAPACPVILEDGFSDTGNWAVFAQPGAIVTPSAGEVRLVAAPEAAGPSAYCEIRSVYGGGIAGSTLTAALSVAELDGSGGVSFNFDPVPAMDADDDLFSLAVAGGVLQAVRKEPSGEFVVLCDPCPPYSTTDHARFRLRASATEVFFETSPDGDDWDELVPAEPISPATYQAVAYAVASNPDVFDMTVDSLQWRTCAD